jgi:hypothetical protein
MGSLGPLMRDTTMESKVTARDTVVMGIRATITTAVQGRHFH